ncbi:CotY/CotZ family spore coat protein [Salimicrobium halophilum]|uniref:Spore coat protein Z n=1 Tax=Salimicrobium halophilum TaxID=86666 RepID=A0A1G8UHK0_9BACI|nr:CotY/CotZ family spore coat protein [Salimicrobium halophilum]SDJ53241.1 Spore coat protein Z [Salimicrobium halophilum]
MEWEKKKPTLKCNHCVCKELVEIQKAQEIVENRKPEKSDCTLGDGEHQKLDTVPFILQTPYGNPFFTFGDVGAGDCFITVFFKVISINHDTCCAKLELLKPNKPITDPDTGSVEIDKVCDVDFVTKTSECITLSLKCFSAIKCLKPSFVKEEGEGKWEKEDYGVGD